MPAIQIHLELRNVKNANEEDLITFLSSIGEVKVEKTAYAAKGAVEAIVIFLGVVGTWATERYVLDPLADRLDVWLKAASSLKGKQFKVVIDFQDSQVKTIETLEISTPLILKELWITIKKISDLLAKNPEYEIINRVMIIPHQAENVLVIGYKGKHPTHLLNLNDQRIIPLRQNAETEQSLSVSIWEIQQLSLRLEYLRLHLDTNDVEIRVLEKEINDKMSACL